MRWVSMKWLEEVKEFSPFAHGRQIVHTGIIVQSNQSQDLKRQKGGE